MTNNNQPITPPSSLLSRWGGDILNKPENVDVVLECAWREGVRAARRDYEQRGADELRKARDEELDACVEWLEFHYPHVCISLLRTARRPKPPVSAEEALRLLDEMDKPSGVVTNSRCIREALERLKELESGQ
jgi:hypothetical protein